jgi:hypothetical protein
MQHRALGPKGRIARRQDNGLIIDFYREPVLTGTIQELTDSVKCLGLVAP